MAEVVVTTEGVGGGVFATVESEVESGTVLEAVGAAAARAAAASFRVCFFGFC
jgi:gamma-glutamyltranspeptidase